jgi:hypothetical protein
MKNVILVVGAGASHELDMPTGYELVERIIKSIDYNPKYRFGNGEGEFLDPVNQFLHIKGIKCDTIQEQEQNKLFFEYSLVPFREALKVWASSRRSLDAFLNQGDLHEIGQQFGKFAIAYHILGQEEWLMRENLYSFHDNWIRHFIEMHLAPIKKELGDEQFTITIITFNYDRIIEHFLYMFLRHTPNPFFSGQESCAIVDRFRIIHVYNKLADLEWQNPEGDYIRFGERNNDKGALTYASGAIQLIGETGIGRVNEEKKTRIREIIRSAKKIYFLGFGFDADNMRILFGDRVFAENFSIRAVCQATAIHLDRSVRFKHPFISYHEVTACQLMQDAGIFTME